MDDNATRPIATTGTVVYRCPCGNRLTLAADKGGCCERCNRTVSPKSLAFDMTSTLSSEEQNFDLATTQPGLGEEEDTTNVASAEPSDEDADLLVGKTFGHFEIIAPLGRGGMGQVYRALDTSLQRFVAVKVLRSGIGNTDEQPASSHVEIDKLLQEAIAQARVPHPNVVTIYYVGKEDGNPFLAMELVNGDTLNQRIAAGDLAYQETASIGLQLASALRASFDLDIIHGDIKPSNVLIARDGTAKLSDFGMARSASENKSVAAGGTPNYLAPELLEGATMSRQSDMYALGVTLYEMTFGELPIKLYGSSVRKWIDTHETSQIEFPANWPADVPEAWRKVLLKLLAKNPDDRYDNYDELLHDFERMQTNSIVAARFFPRLIAAGVDWASVLLLTIGFQTAVLILAGQQSTVQGQLGSFWSVFIGAMTFLPIIVYTAVVYYWRQTIGRNLMHLRVVNPFGLRPLGRQMVIRSFLRMQFPWVVILVTLLVNTPLALVAYIGYILSLLFLLADIIYMLISNGRSFHDLFAKTRVVLDTDQ